MFLGIGWKYAGCPSFLVHDLKRGSSAISFSLTAKIATVFDGSGALICPVAINASILYGWEHCTMRSAAIPASCMKYDFSEKLKGDLGSSTLSDEAIKTLLRPNLLVRY